ncbi:MULTISPECIES: cupin domain-containing protein [unclassified Caballeronia]|uniref:cupin domain-containing protein n=1 Tax=unclassified Caballeronia TaxID=2646786 RepID=UPI00285B5787|nr:MULTISPECIES: cupin domain-containing protein [unclassified Caballeronia]MDR5816338.1 cupin domain-containing protein [Caballeronia sp. LZ033]MDR5823005.1 cupin domain-containing protein [Caballeronia sp. LZ043]MDR5837842.1 cupin domain-containing protein [Caballeronia sp. LZ034LL]MDR5881064.1 cupin domain-containing protein [Caballeronia sp. LZ032]
MNTPVFEAVRLDDVLLKPDPIDPAWIIEGHPVARSGQWSRSRDTTTSSWVWDCTAGRFRWYFDADETIYVIEGEVIVTSEGQAPRSLRAGDAALFYAGTCSEWYVPKYVRKHAILRPHISKPVLLALKMSRRLRRRPSGYLPRSSL